MTDTADASLVHRLIDAFNARDLGAIDGLVTDDFVDHHLPPEIPAGPDGLKMWFGIAWSAFDAKLSLNDVVAGGDRIAARWTFAGTHIGDFNGLPASGREFSIQGMSIERVEGGRIAERWEIADLFLLLQQVEGEAPVAPADR